MCFKSSNNCLTISVHSNFEAFLQTAGLALVSSGDIYGAGVALLALISKVSSDAPLEKSTTTIACKHAVMLSRGSVATDFAQNCLLGF